MSKIVLRGYILVPDTDLKAVQGELANHIALTRDEAGCLVFEVVQDQHDSNRFNVYEEFSSRETFQLHQTRVVGSKWGEITANIERHYTVEEIEDVP